MDEEKILRRAGFAPPKKWEVEKIALMMRDGSIITVVPYEVKDFQGNRSSVNLRMLYITVKEWYDNGEQPQATV